MYLIVIGIVPRFFLYFKFTICAAITNLRSSTLRILFVNSPLPIIRLYTATV